MVYNQWYFLQYHRSPLDGRWDEDHHDFQPLSTGLVSLLLSLSLSLFSYRISKSRITTCSYIYDEQHWYTYDIYFKRRRRRRETNDDTFLFSFFQPLLVIFLSNFQVISLTFKLLLSFLRSLYFLFLSFSLCMYIFRMGSSDGDIYFLLTRETTCGSKLNRTRILFLPTRMKGKNTENI